MGLKDIGPQLFPFFPLFCSSTGKLVSQGVLSSFCSLVVLKSYNHMTTSVAPIRASNNDSEAARSDLGQAVGGVLPTVKVVPRTWPALAADPSSGQALHDEDSAKPEGARVQSSTR